MTASPITTAYLDLSPDIRARAEELEEEFWSQTVPQGSEVTVAGFIARAIQAERERDRWQPIETAPKDGNRYEISSSGQVKVNGLLREAYETDKGYLRVTIGEKTVSVHRLVALHFVPNPRHLAEVNHKDGDKKNNEHSNLEWVTRSENMKHAYAAGLHPGVALFGEQNPNWGRRGAKHNQSLPVRATFKDGSFRDYESQRLAEADGFRSPKISQCITGKRKSHGGATWQPLPAPPATEREAME
ncbi:hypothetical protein GOC16_08530 [Sinorhizobium meliloti]|nr:hypothetical protein [Sinorhizobium meliloti]